MSDFEITPSNLELNYVSIPDYFPVSNNSSEAETNTLGGLAQITAAPNIVEGPGGSVMPTGEFKSPNYVPGIAGWKIDSNGNVEFGNGYFRGDITGASGTFSGSISATSGTIGGFTINATTLSATGLILDSGNQKITLGASGNTIILDAVNKYIKSSDYSAGNSGFIVSPTIIETQDLRARGIFSTTVFQKNVVSAVGGQLLVTNADILDADMTALDNSTLTISASSSFAVNDMLHIKDATNEEYLRVTNIASAPTYSVTRDLAGAYAANNNPIWKKGTAVVVEGSSNGVGAYSGGFLRLFGAGANSPYYSVFQRSGVTYNSLTEAVRLGNLNGIGPFVSDTYGIFIGNYSTGKYLTYDNLSGQLIVNGYLTSSKGAFGGDGSDGALAISSGTTTINLGGLAEVTKNYTSISITGTGKLAFSNAHSNGTKINLKSQGNITLTSSNPAMIDASGTGGAGGAGGAGSVGGTGVAGANGVIGNTGTLILDSVSHYGNFGNRAVNGTTPGGASTGGTVLSEPLNIYTVKDSNGISRKAIFLACGSGAGGGGGGTYSAGGAGGAGGGVLYIECGGSWNFTTGGISVNGINGTQGVDLGTFIGGAGGGGGGGASGMFLALYNSLIANTGTISVASGTGGNGGSAKGNGSGGNAAGGGGGSGAGLFGAGGAGGGGVANNNDGLAGSVGTFGGGGGGGGGAAALSDLLQHVGGVGGVSSNGFSLVALNTFFA